MECAFEDTYKTYRTIILIFIFTLPTHAKGQCPAQCTCNPSTGGQSVKCGTGLSAFPTNVPTNTEILSIFPLHSQSPNNIPSLAPTDFVNLKNVVRIQIQRSNVQNLAPSTFSQLMKLTGLDLRDNKLTHVTKSALTGLNSLELLDLSDNAGCQIDKDAFQDLRSLKILRLGNMGLRNIDDIFHPLTALEELDLHENNLHRIPAASLAPLNNLKLLDLTYNDLINLQENLFPQLAGLRGLFLGHNPWRCTCALLWFKKLPSKFMFSRHSGNAICFEPAAVQFMDILNVKDSEFKCTPAKISACTAQVTAKEGSQIVITCDVEGDPFPDVTWKSPNGTDVSHVTMTQVKDTVNLTIPSSLYQNHNGQWTILAESYNTSDTQTIDVTIITTTTTSTTTTTPSTTTSTLPPSTVSTQSTQSLPVQNYSNNIDNNPKVVAVIAGTAAGGVVCLIGIFVFAAVLYRTRTRRRISDRRNSWSENEDIVLYIRSPLSTAKPGPRF